MLAVTGTLMDVRNRYTMCFVFSLHPVDLHLQAKTYNYCLYFRTLLELFNDVITSVQFRFSSRSSGLGSVLGDVSPLPLEASSVVKGPELELENIALGGALAC